MRPQRPPPPYSGDPSGGAASGAPRGPAARHGARSPPAHVLLEHSKRRVGVLLSPSVPRTVVPPSDSFTVAGPVASAGRREFTSLLQSEAGFRAPEGPPSPSRKLLPASCGGRCPGPGPEDALPVQEPAAAEGRRPAGLTLRVRRQGSPPAGFPHPPTCANSGGSGAATRDRRGVTATRGGSERGVQSRGTPTDKTPGGKRGVGGPRINPPLGRGREPWGQRRDSEGHCFPPAFAFAFEPSTDRSRDPPGTEAPPPAPPRPPGPPPQTPVTTGIHAEALPTGESPALSLPQRIAVLHASSEPLPRPPPRNTGQGLYPRPEEAYNPPQDTHGGSQPSDGKNTPPVLSNAIQGLNSCKRHSKDGAASNALCLSLCIL
ncbi:basic salivary proline-rich protein 2-like [Perognathus longimembris pacificus]|uniref:basic salivary proline-rich protein 2-like n=1 Tax=Perognathus longimembris pacificus TaxID=214514 RepID=UPI002019C972|nr:basic salivary proline-rich protein 2-like [Perognathus longimembris pacificus]